MSQRYLPHGTEYDYIGKNMPADMVFYKPGGCDNCNQHGFTGRRGIYELLVVDDEVGNLILANADATQIKRAATNSGMDSLRDDGARKVMAGLTTVEEVLKAKQEDIMEESPSSVAPASVATEPLEGP